MNNNLNFFLYIMLTNNTQNKYFLKVFCSVRLLLHLLQNFYEQHEKIILRQILITKVANTQLFNGQCCGSGAELFFWLEAEPKTHANITVFS